MPRTEIQESDDLSIQLLNPQTPLYGGSVILARVVRKSPIVAPSATISVRVHGRAKVKLVDNFRDGARTWYRNRVNFWPYSGISDVVHQGPLHIARDGGESRAWTFALTLRTHTETGAVNDCEHEILKEACFLTPVSGAGPATKIPEQPLPGSFYHENRRFRGHWHGFVEYWIEAELELQGDSPVVKATLPIRVFAPPPPAPPISDFGLVTKMSPGRVASQRLLPGMESAELSFKQKTRKFFASSKVPRFHFTLDVQCPTVIQMGSESSIPFLLRVTPDREKTDDAIRDVPPSVFVKSVALRLWSITSIVCVGALGLEVEAEKQSLYLARTDTNSHAATETYMIPSGPKGEPLDFGAVLGIRVDALGRVLHGTTVQPNPGTPVFPSFTTYCLKAQHCLEWEVVYSVARETSICRGAEELLILAPCEDMASGRAEASATAAATSAPPPPAMESVQAYSGPGEVAPPYTR